ncbi:MAG: hypothetical protein GX345_02065 [Clostridiales bacterium]|nr:hypothetical protein [Clostridiales bacterium]
MNVYDFDNTIYRGESGVDLFFYFLKKDPSLLKKIPNGAKLIVKYKTGEMTVQEILDNYVEEIVDYGESIENFDAHVIDFWDKNARKIKPFYLKQRKADDLIISACPEIVLKEIMMRLELTNFMGTETEEGSMKLVRLMYGKNKLTAFKERYPDAKIKNFYTDSYSDRPLIEIAENAFMVRGNKVTKIK